MSLMLTFVVRLKMMQRHASRVAFVFALVRRTGQDEACDPATLHDLCERLPMFCGRRRSKNPERVDKINQDRVRRISVADFVARSKIQHDRFAVVTEI
jgi:hypothetical protein